MTSTRFNDATCTLTADKVSCDAMSFLAKDEYAKNKQFENYLLQDPSCSRYQSLANREEEHFLQKSLGISRNVCFEKTAEFQTGPWEQQYTNQMSMPTFYEKWTRAKNQRLECQPPLDPCFLAQLTTEKPFPGPQGFNLRD